MSRRALGLLLMALVVLTPFSALASASEPAPEPAVAGDVRLDAVHLHSATEEPRIEVGLAYQDPAARGVAGILDVTLTPRGAAARDAALLVSAPEALVLVALRAGEIGTIAEDATFTVRYLVTARDEGVHALTFRAMSTSGIEGKRQAWLNVTTLDAATLMVDHRTDEPRVGRERASTHTPRGADATDVTPEEPGVPDVAWPPVDDPDAQVAGQVNALAASAAGGADEPSTAASGGTFSARICWNFEDPERNLGEEWLRARWMNFRVMASVAGPDRQLAQGITGKDGCVRVDGLPRSVDGAPTKAYFVLRTCNAAACVRGMDQPDGYVWQTGWMVIGEGQTLLDWGDRVPSTHLYAGRVFARAMNGWSWFVNVGGTPKAILEKADIYTPSKPYGGGTYMSWSKEIYIEVDGSADVAEETVLHEYSHFWHFSLATWFPSDAGGKHWICDPWQRKGLAWTEGFAYFTATRANHDLGKLGVPGASGDAALHTYGIESNSCGNEVGNSPVSSQNEFRVARTLWDLTDSANDGYDVGAAASLQDLLLVVRTCSGWDIRDILHNEDCGWKQAGHPVCGFLRATHQNIYDANEPPTATFPTLAGDTWVHDDVIVSATVADMDGGTGNCPTTTRFVAATSSFCPEDHIIGISAGSAPSALFQTEQVWDNAYYLCAFTSDGLETRAQISQTRYLVDNTGPRIELLQPLQAWYDSPPSMPNQCVDDGVGYENAYGNRRIRIDNGTWDAQASFASVSTEGRHWADIECYDRLGNRGVRGFPLNYDGTDPVLAYTTSPAPFDRDRVTVTMTCQDALSGCGHVYYTYAGTSANYTGPFHLTTLATVTMGAIDRANNRVTISEQLGVERGAPVVSIENSSHTEALSLPGWHWSEPEITIPCADAVSGVGGITYRVNGGPNVTYLRPFLLGIQGNVNLTATCTDGARNTANVTKLVKVDTEPPTVATSLAGTVGNAGWYRSNVTLTVACADNGSGIRRVDHRLDNGSWIEIGATPPVTTLAADGAMWLESRCGDRVGSQASVAQRVLIDRTAPNATIVLDAASPANRSVNVTIVCIDPLSASGCANVTHRIDGGAWRTGASFAVAQEGAHVVEAYGTDVAGNAGAIVDRRFTIDLTRPALDVTFNGTLGSNGWYTTSVLMAASCTDALAGVVAKEYRVNGGSWTAFGANVTFGVSGARILEVRCLDAAGNEVVQTYPLRIDRNAPSTTLSPATSAWTNAASVEVAIGCFDAASGCNLTTYRIDGGEWGIAFGGSIAIGTEGDHVIEARSTDHAGLTSLPVTASVRIDRTPPAPNTTLAPAAPASGWYVGNVTASASCADAAGGSGVLRLEAGWLDQPSVPYVGPVTLSREGSHTWSAQCTDVAGNVARATRLVRTDLAPPTTTVSAPTTWQRTNVSVSVACSDAASGCATRRVRIDGGAWQDLPLFGGFLVTTDGDHLVEAMSTDVSGRNSSIVSTPVRIDRVAPTVGVGLASPVPATGWFRASVNATASCSDALSGAAMLLAGYRNETQPAYVAPVPIAREGNHEWQARCTDAAGNTAVASQWVKVDLRAPDVAFRAMTLGTEFAFAWDVTDAVSGLTGTIVVEEQGVRVNTVVCSQAASGAARSGSCDIPGAYEPRCYRVRATDAAGWTTTTAWECLQLYHE